MHGISTQNTKILHMCQRKSGRFQNSGLVCLERLDMVTYPFYACAGLFVHAYLFIGKTSGERSPGQLQNRVLVLVHRRCCNRCERDTLLSDSICVTSTIRNSNTTLLHGRQQAAKHVRMAMKQSNMLPPDQSPQGRRKRRTRPSHMHACPLHSFGWHMRASFPQGLVNPIAEETYRLVRSKPLHLLATIPFSHTSGVKLQGP